MQAETAVVQGKAAAGLPAVPINADAAVDSSDSASRGSGQQTANGALVVAPQSPQPGNVEDRLGRPLQPNLPYEVSESGPPLPPCQEARCDKPYY